MWSSGTAHCPGTVYRWMLVLSMFCIASHGVLCTDQESVEEPVNDDMRETESLDQNSDELAGLTSEEANESRDQLPLEITMTINLPDGGGKSRKSRQDLHGSAARTDRPIDSSLRQRRLNTRIYNVKPRYDLSPEALRSRQRYGFSNMKHAQLMQSRLLPAYVMAMRNREKANLGPLGANLSSEENNDKIDLIRSLGLVNSNHFNDPQLQQMATAYNFRRANLPARGKRVRDLGSLDLERTWHLLTQRRRAKQSQKLKQLLENMIKYRIISPEDLYL